VRDVVDYPSGGQPVFVPAALDNVTVIEGQRSTLLCRVYGDVSTRLQVSRCLCACLSVCLSVCPSVDLSQVGPIQCFIACMTVVGRSGGWMQIFCVAFIQIQVL